ncbi:hypothetical protein [Mycolicibacter engbaekii]|uniref:hypothetical protein n=1 Tax=Mycolicibacter engbaekii TaxID=188915 RepID=UPI001F1921B7|nr:hypothetical protein [Mycolicibacter engbaekii]
MSGAFAAARVKDDVEATANNPGAWAVIVGLIAIVVGAAYLWTEWRSIAALAAAVLGGLDLLLCLVNVMNVSALFGDSNAGSYSVGFGLLLACATTLTLVGVGITGFVLERSAISSRSQKSEQ